MKITSKQFHWRAKQNKRNAKAKRWTKEFTQFEQNDLKNRTLYPVTPSPLGKHWLNYVHHRLKMVKKGLEAYTTRKYTRLSLDKYIESSRAIDQIAGEMVNGQPALVFLGNGGDTPPNSPIRIKKHVRCPGKRKILRAFKKRRKVIVLPVDEYFTSQTCGRCLQRLDIRTKNTNSRCVKTVDRVNRHCYRRKHRIT